MEVLISVPHSSALVALGCCGERDVVVQREEIRGQESPASRKDEHVFSPECVHELAVNGTVVELPCRQESHWIVFFMSVVVFEQFIPPRSAVTYGVVRTPVDHGPVVRRFGGLRDEQSATPVFVNQVTCPGILACGALNDDDKIQVPVSRTGGVATEPGGLARAGCEVAVVVSRPGRPLIA